MKNELVFKTLWTYMLLQPLIHTTEIFGESGSKKIFVSHSKLTLIPLKTSFSHNRLKLQDTHINWSACNNSRSRPETHTSVSYCCDDKYNGLGITLLLVIMWEGPWCVIWVSVLCSWGANKAANLSCNFQFFLNRFALNGTYIDECRW